MSDSSDSWITDPSVQEFPGYTLCEEIGRGGMGIVYRARDTRFERDVAIKLLADRIAADSAAAGRFRNEARITGQLQHPGIPPAHELGILADGRLFLVMKLVKGATLQAMLDRRAEPGDDRGRLIAIFEQICHAVGYAHAHGVIHRDLKPANVMVGRFGEVQIMDWGLAKVLGERREEAQAESISRETVAMVSGSALETPVEADSATRTGLMLGTPAYMPPEQAGGEIRRLDARSDVFALGAILCKILTGEPIYSGEYVNEVRIKAIRGDLREANERLDRCGAEPDYVALAKQCLAFRQEERPANGRAVADEIARIRTHAEARAREAELERSAALVREAEGKKRRTQFFVAANCIGAALVLGIIGTSYGLWRAERAVVAESKAKDAARRKQQEAESEHTRAEEREREAIVAVQRFGDAVANHPELKNSEQLKSLRQELLKEPLAFFRSLRERLEAGKNRGQESLLRLAFAAYNLGVLTDEIGDKQDARRAYEEARAILEGLVKEKPHDAEILRTLAMCAANFGNLLHAIGKPSEAQQALEQSISIRQRLVDEHPAEIEFQTDLAASHNNLGRLFHETERPAEARIAYEKANAIRDRLVREHPADLNVQSSLAVGHNNLGALLHQTNRLEEALAEYVQAKTIRLRLAREKPEISKYQNDLAATLQNLGALQVELGKPGDALASFQEAKAIRERLVAAHPTVTTFQDELAGSLNNLGLLLFELNKPAEALQEFAQAKAARERLLRENPTDVHFQSNLALTCLSFGNLYRAVNQPTEALAEFEAARKIWEELCRNHTTVAQYQSDLGGVLNNIALLKIKAEKFAEARSLLQDAIGRQRAALAGDPNHPAYRQSLQNHYLNLKQAAAGLKDSALEAEAEKGLEALAASDPRLLALDRRLAAVEGGAAASGVEELLDLGMRAYDLEKFALSARLYGHAFEAEASIADRGGARHAYNAACSAVLAAGGSGKEAPADDAVRVKLRGNALTWLKWELDRWEKILDAETAPEARQAIAATLLHWQRDSDLTGIREAAQLASLPQPERKDWETLWAKVKELLEKALPESKPEVK